MRQVWVCGCGGRLQPKATCALGVYYWCPVDGRMFCVRVAGNETTIREVS